MSRLSKRSLEGEILIDHSASPGLTREQIGYFDAPAVPKGEIFESAIVICSHCQAAVILNPQRTRDRGWCAKCDKYLCDECTETMHRTLECRSFERLKDQVLDLADKGVTNPLLFPQL